MQKLSILFPAKMVVFFCFVFFLCFFVYNASEILFNSFLKGTDNKRAVIYT